MFWIQPIFFCGLLVTFSQEVNGGRGLLLHSNAFGIPIPTVGDKFSFARSDELKTLLGINPESGGVIPFQAQEYKCYVLNALYQNLNLNFQNTPDHKNLMRRIDELLDNCGRPNFRMAEYFNQSFIFPGTKWCGQGNVAENFHDLGVFNESDACCREHDFCDDIINARRTKHNLVNPFGTTRLHCKCDEALRQCFRKVNSVISNTIGYIFFSLLQTQCFDFEHPTNGCEIWKRGAVRQFCVKYKLQKDQPKKWQWFDQEPYF